MMPRPVMKTLSASNHSVTTLHGLEQLWDEQMFCDAKLHAKGGTILLAHKVLLMSCSGYFYKYFSCKHVEETTPDNAYLEEATAETVSTILHFIYTGNLTLSTATVKNVLGISEFLEMQEVKDLCTQFTQNDRRMSCSRGINATNPNAHGIPNASGDEDQEDTVAVDNLATRIPGSGITGKLISGVSGSARSRNQRSLRSKSSHYVEEGSLELVTIDDDNIMPLSLGAKRRKPGRPQKLTDQATVAKSITRKEDIPTSRTKRKCTRPKKLEDYKVTSADQQSLDRDNSEPTPTPKKGRGRPRKSGGVVGEINTPEQTVVSSTQSVQVDSPGELRRKRGRPKGAKGKKGKANIALVTCTDPGDDEKEETSYTEVLTPKDEEEVESAVAACTEDSTSTRQSSRKRKCRRCSMEFETAKCLERHRIQCRKDIQFDKPDKYKRKKCGKCKVEFPDFQSYEEHRKLHQKDRASRTTEKSHLCEYCNLSFRYDNFLACHKYSKHRIPFDESKYTVMNCSTCDYMTINKWRFKVHTEQHDNQRPYVCDICGKSFKVSSSLTSHKHTHMQERKYECPECGKKFMQLNGREQHIRRIHKKEMSFLCHLCPYKCFVKSELLQHLFKDHHVPLPKKYVRYKCELCEFMTFRRFHYLNHMNMHEGKRIFECEICHKKYTSKVVLRCHMQFHKEPRHKCTWEGCNYAAVQRRRLDQHVRLIHTHKDDKPFTCHICTYRTALNGNLKLHLRNVHHLDIPRRQLLKRNAGTPGDGQKGVSMTTAPASESPVLSSMSSEDLVTFAVTNCQDVTSVTTPGGDNEDKNTVVYTILQSTDLPSQVTAAQVLQQLSTGGSSPPGHPQTTPAGAESVHFVEQATSVIHIPMATQESGLGTGKHMDMVANLGAGGDRIVRVTRGHLIQELTAGDLGAEIHVPVSRELGSSIQVMDRDVPENVSRGHSLLSREMLPREMPRELHIQRDDSGGMGREMNREIHTQREDPGAMVREMPREYQLVRELQVNRDMHRELPVRDMSADMVRDLNRDLLVSRDLSQDLQRDMGRDSGIVMREMMNAQFPPESYLPDGRNINMIMQPMENRETYPPPQGSYWTQY